MQITFDIPEDIATRLGAESGGSLEQRARESLLVEAYRRGLVSIGRLAEMLGMGVIEADRWLAGRKVPLNYTAAELIADCATLESRPFNPTCTTSVMDIDHSASNSQ